MKASMPLLNFIAACNFFVLYWVDKSLFISLYRTPMVDEHLAFQTSRFLLFSVPVHLLVSIWAFTNHDILQSDKQVQPSFQNQQFSNPVEYIFSLRLVNAVGAVWLIIIVFISSVAALAIEYCFISEVIMLI